MSDVVSQVVWRSFHPQGRTQRVARRSTLVISQTWTIAQPFYLFHQITIQPRDWDQTLLRSSYGLLQHSTAQLEAVAGGKQGHASWRGVGCYVIGIATLILGFLGGEMVDRLGWQGWMDGQRGVPS